MEPVLHEVRDGIAFITLNRPQRLNAINFALLGGLVAELRSAMATDDAEVVLLQASGRAFCAGDDLEEFAHAEYTLDQVRAFNGRLQEVSRLMMLGDKPVVCAAQGWIVGGGASWLLNADFALADRTATLFCPEAGLGLFPSGGMTMLLAERCGPMAANEILWLGARRTAQELLDLRVISRMTAPGQLSADALTLAGQLRALPRASRLRLKRARSSDLRERLERALEVEFEYCVQAALDPASAERVRQTGRR